MKLVYCLECGDIFSPGTDTPKRCVCGYSIGQWEDAGAGTLRVASRIGDDLHLRIIGLNNDWLKITTDLRDDDELHKHWTERTCDRADGYLFKTRNSPVVMMTVRYGGQLRYDESLLKEVKWWGKFDCAKPKEDPEILP